MTVIWKIVYNLLVLPVLVAVVYITALFNSKFRQGVKGRFLTLRRLRKFFRTVDRSNHTYWFHAASHGEYEQVRPVIKGLKEIIPNCVTLVSFFSPSGYHNVIDENIDCKIYLPIDFPLIVNRALRVVRPKKIIFAAYDVWPNLIWQASRQGIHTTIFSARFSEGTTKLYPVIRSFYRNVYSHFSTIYTITDNDNERLHRILDKRDKPLIRVLGNPRYDQVKHYADKFTTERTESVLSRDRRLVVGSVWPEDENIILEPIIRLLNEYPDLSLLWVPHEPNGKYISHSVDTFSSHGFKTATYVSCDGNIRNGARVIVVDIVGTLANLYWQGQIAYVGGGFSTGVHNVMEPAIARLPVLFGPRYSNSQEAEQLLEYQGGFTIADGAMAYAKIRQLMTEREYFLEASLAATDVIHRNLGSATRVVRGIIRD
ncbi:MAG: glycosyltransferase N-terminal domain-containing protein [Candidatus Neomarinimicrobiota bacterium]